MSPLPESPLTSAEVTLLLEQWRAGSEDAGEQLLPMMYHVLHDIAARLMRQERTEHTLQPTILLHDAWLRLSGERGTPWNDRNHFLALATRAMRRLLVDHARARGAAKRRGDLAMPLADDLLPATGPDPIDLIALDMALDDLARVDDRARRVVELRYFGGLEWPEIAAVTGASERTVHRDWRFASAWLRCRMEAGPADGTPLREVPPTAG